MTDNCPVQKESCSVKRSSCPVSLKLLICQKRKREIKKKSQLTWSCSLSNETSTYYNYAKAPSDLPLNGLGSDLSSNSYSIHTEHCLPLWTATWRTTAFQNFKRNVHLRLYKTKMSVLDHNEMKMAPINYLNVGLWKKQFLLYWLPNLSS